MHLDTGRTEGRVVCKESECKDLVCQVGYTPEVVSSYGAPSECCPLQICVPLSPSALSCPPLSKPQCGLFQAVKSVNDVDSCPTLVCGKYIYDLPCQVQGDILMALLFTIIMYRLVSVHLTII